LFDAWGALIKLKVFGLPATVIGAGLIIDRGYTGHEHLWSVGLVHMNARLYDAKLHRFLQPDNFVQDPSNTQSFNRYAYCMNNPLRFTDYSGESWWDDNWKTVVSVVAAVGTAAIIIGTAGAATPFMVAVYAGAGGGLVGGMVGTGLNGGSFSDVLGAGVKGAFFGAIGGALGFGAGLLAPAGAINGLFYGATSNVVVGGVLNAVQDRPIFEGAGLSAVLGGAGGFAGGYHKAQAQGLNPITGTPKASVVAKNVNTSIEKAQIDFDKSTRTQAEPINMSNTVANETPIFRGGSSTKLSPADIKSSVDQSGIAQPGKGGLSVNTNKFDTNVQKYGGAFEVNTKSLPNGLQILNKPVGSSHFIITPSYPMPQNVFQSLLNDVEILKLNSIRN
jgi:RHS repeat-associated protein